MSDGPSARPRTRPGRRMALVVDVAYVVLAGLAVLCVVELLYG